MYYTVLSSAVLCCAAYDCSLRYNRRYAPTVPWGPEWYEASKKSTDFLLGTESLNRTHPGYYRALPEDVQMACVRRILGCLTTRNPFLDRNIRWRHSTMRVVHCRLTGKCCTMLYNVVQRWQY